MPDDRLITDREVGRIYGIGRSTVWEWCERGIIPKPIVQRKKYTRWSHLQIQEAIRALGEAERNEAAS